MGSVIVRGYIRKYLKTLGNIRVLWTCANYYISDFVEQLRKIESVREKPYFTRVSAVLLVKSSGKKIQQKMPKSLIFQGFSTFSDCYCVIRLCSMII